MATLKFKDGNKWVDLLDTMYPIGSIYMSYNDTSPANTIGGTWVEIMQKGFFKCRRDDTEEILTEGGNNVHNHTDGDFRAFIGATNGLIHNIGYVHATPQNPNTGEQNYMPSINVKGADASQNNGFFNHFVPVKGYTAEANHFPTYITVCCWRRTA